MPKQHIIENKYPTLRKPLSQQKNEKSTITLRERTNISNISSLLISNEIPLNTLNNNIINNQENLPPKYISSHNVNTRALRKNNIDDIDNQNILNRPSRDMTERIEDNFQDFDFNNNNTLLSDDFSFPLIRPNSPTMSDNSSNSDDDNTDGVNFTQITSDSKKYYDVDSILPGYTGDSGPYFPSLTAMWMFIWFTKNSIERIEIWHGDLWKESPLFGETSIVINDVTFKAGEWIEYKEFHDQHTLNRVGRITGIVMIDESLPDRFFRIQTTRTFYELPGTLKSKERYQRLQLHNELWLEEIRSTIKIQDLIRHVNVWIKDDNTPRLPTFEFSIQEIIYTFNGRQKIRHVSLRHKLPIEYISAPQLPSGQNIKHYKFFIDLYFDDFGAFNKAYHTLGGIYIQLGNMSRELRKKLRNHFLIGFVPFGGEFEDTIEEFISDMKELQNGIPMMIKDEQVWISAGFGMGTADLPQGNDMAGIKRHNAEYGCRTCKVSQSQLSDADFDIFQNGRYHHLTSRIYDEIKTARNSTTKKNIAQEYGLCLNPNILDDLARDHHLQTPQDPFHCLAGLACRLLDHLFNHELERSGLDALHSTWLIFEMPRNWKRIQSPITHLDSYWMSDSLRLVMIMPFILSRCLNTTQLKQCFVITVKNNFELTNSRQVKAVIVKTWSLFARLCAKVFANVFHKSDYQALDQLVIKLTRILNKIYPDMITTLPNIHVLRHLPLIAATYGTLQNVSVSLKEMMHGVYKRMIPHTNKKNVEFDLIKRDNILQGLRYVIDNGYDARIPEGGGNCIRSILKDEQLICLLEGWYISVPAHHITRLEEYNTVEQEQENVIEPPQECFFNIRVHKKWNTKRIEKEGFVKKISNEIQKNLYEAYRHYLNKETAISFKTLEYYDAISYTIIKEDNVDISIHVGEVIDIEDDGTKNREYALIRGIFTHQANDYKKYAFFILDWYYDTGRIDDLTGCRIYGLQESKDVLWPHIHSFHIVDRNPHVHFVHNCKANCTNEHKTNNLEYLRNEFFYLAV
ncbi:hypothetical protein RhiirA1_515098 [Rhizophagus irregularis]|uniref:BAH domain-containing protein n=5 Tax=Rhizophagus irregularis TaxID=588596 RepID=A0A2N0RPF1_9GLOM|nr:hypothetical protein RhiirA1_515098 [Rhizophagus irregularis]